MNIRISGSSKKGLRKVQQDSFRYLQAGDYALLAIADGNGGTGGGDLARFAVDTIISRLSIFLSNNRKIGSDEELKALGMGTLKYAADAVYKFKSQHNDWENAGTTITLTIVTPMRISAFWIGDSPSIAYQAGDLTQLTFPVHTLAEKLIEEGRPRESIAMQPSLHSVLTNCGGFENYWIDHRIIKLEGPAIILTGSDGIFGYFPDSELIDILRNNFSKCFDIGELVDSIIDTSLLTYDSDDNCTLIGCFAQPHLNLAKSTRHLTRMYEF